MRDMRSGSALVAAGRSAQERRALRRLSSSCLAVRERRCTGAAAASSSGSLQTSRAACTVCRRRATGGDVSRDTNDSNIALVVVLPRPFTAHSTLKYTHYVLYSESTYAYKERLCCDTTSTAVTLSPQRGRLSMAS